MKLKLTFAIALLGLISCTLQGNKGKEEDLEDCISLVENDLVGTQWRIDQLLCLQEDVDRYTLNKIDTTQRGYPYGDLIRFTDSSNFISYYTAPCGNDCFRTVFGTYNLLTENMLAISVDSVTYNGDCHTPTEYRKAKGLNFVINRTDSAFYLEKAIN